MDQYLTHIVSAIVGAIITSVSWVIARAKADGTHEERARVLGERVAQLEARLERVAGDVNRIGIIAREARTVATIGMTGEPPRTEIRESGPTPRVP